MSKIPPAGRRLAPVLLVLAAATLSACAGSAPVAVAPPPPRPAPQPVRAPLPPAPVPVVVPPSAPPQAPRGTVASRAYYAGADVTEWVLTNGATVVFKPLPNGGAADVLAFRRATDRASLGSCEMQATARRPTSDLAGLFEMSLGQGAVYVVVGDARPGEVEQAAARLLTRPDTPGRCADVPAGERAYTVPAAPETDATFAVLVELLGAPARTTRDAWAGTTTLHARLSTRQPTAASVAAARAAVTERLAESPAFWATALADLYRTDDRLRPTRDPAFVEAFAARVARVSPQAVSDLAARLAASP